MPAPTPAAMPRRRTEAPGNRPFRHRTTPGKKGGGGTRWMPFNESALRRVADGSKRVMAIPVGRFKFAGAFGEGSRFEMRTRSHSLALQVQVVAAKRIRELSELPDLGLPLQMWGGSFQGGWPMLLKMMFSGVRQYAEFKQMPVERVLREGWMVVLVEPVGEIREISDQDRPQNTRQVRSASSAA